MSDLVPFLGTWVWWILAGILLVGELLAPGIFLLWLGFAAALTGVADLVFNLGWRGEVALFAVLSLVLVLLSWRWVMAQHAPKSDQPHLNQRHGAYVGHIYLLHEAIENGTGKVRIEDTLWEVEGPDLPKGTRVKIIGVNGMKLLALAA